MCACTSSLSRRPPGPLALTSEDQGGAVAREIAGEPQFTDTLLIAISGYTQPDDVRRAQEAGFHHHFAKPVPINRLNDLLQEWNSDGS